MYTELLKKVFHISMENMIEETIYQRLLEKKLNDNKKDEKNKQNNARHDEKHDENDFFSVLSDSSSVLKWCVHEDDKDLDHMITRLDAKIDLLEHDEDFKKILTEYFPKEGDSYYYTLLYSISYLYYSISQLENKTNNKLTESRKRKPDDIQLPPLYSAFINNIINYILDSSSNQEIAKQQLHIQLKRFIDLISNIISKNSSLVMQYRKFMLVVVQLSSFVFLLLDRSSSEETAVRLSISSMALHISKKCYQVDDIERTIRFSICTILADNPEDKLQAFNLLGLSALESSQYQLAYDVYFSWINLQLTESIQLGFKIDGSIFSKMANVLNNDSETQWRARKANKRSIAMMYGNYAYVCGVMYDLLKVSKQKSALICLAKHYIKRAISYDGASNNYYCSAGTIFSDAGDNDQALCYYQKYYDKSSTVKDIVNALYSILLVYKENLADKERFDDETCHKFESLVVEFLSKYDDLLKDSKYSDAEEITNARDLYYLLSECMKLSKEKKGLTYLLLQIDNVRKKMLNILRQSSHPTPTFNLHLDLLSKEEHIELIYESANISENDVNNSNDIIGIAYYTQLSKLKYLFSGIKQDDVTTINCLTMMHSLYMNDPNEGLILLQKLKDYLPEAPIEIRNELYDKKFIFLKSFTGLIDQLNMWTSYGSDRENGKDCDGCCICIAPETFDIVSRLQNKSRMAISVRKDDDFHLYSVAYIDKDRIIVNGQRSETLEKQYDNLKNLIKNLHQGLSNASDADIRIVTNCLVQLFEKIVFLFKDASYRLEVESRLIISRDVRDRSEIKETDTIPKKLFINPKFQVFPERIILGPKVENPDYWIPHLQYELSQISEKWPTDMKRAYKPTVRISEINIR